jgi:MFS family permease
VLEAYWQPLFLELLGGNQTGMLGVLATLYFVAVTAGNLLSERLLSRHKVGEKAMYLAGRFGMLACIACAALIPQAAVFMAFYCLMYFCLGASNIAEGALIHREVPDASRASMLSVQSFMMQAGVLAASAGAGAAASAVSIPTIWLVAAGASALLLTPAIRIAGWIKSKKEAESGNVPPDLPFDGGEESTET